MTWTAAIYAVGLFLDKADDVNPTIELGARVLNQPIHTFSTEAEATSFASAIALPMNEGLPEWDAAPFQIRFAWRVFNGDAPETYSGYLGKARRRTRAAAKAA